MIGLRAYLLAGGVAALIALVGVIYFAGADAERKEIRVEQLEAQVRDATKARETQVAVAQAADKFATEAIRLHQEAADGRRDIDRFATAPPAQGYVGTDALVSPDLARAVLCRIGRLRGQIPTYCAPAAVVGQPADEPVPQRVAA